MKDLAFVLHRVNAGDRVTLYTDVYGTWRLELRTGWLRRKVHVELELADVETVKQALRSRRDVPGHTISAQPRRGG